MREIKFRGKRLNDGEWIYGYYCQTRNCSYIIEGQSGIISSYNEVDPKTVGQFTGLKDKNGKEIYEGDIVKRYVEDAPNNCKKYNGAIGAVEYSHYSLGEFVISLIKGDEWSFYYPDGDNFTTEDLEVIGNIHENSELIKN